jgi:hypothetical protein
MGKHVYLYCKLKKKLIMKQGVVVLPALGRLRQMDFKFEASLAT